MIKFWSFESEYKKYKKNILKIIDKSLSSGLIFYGNNLINFERDFTRKYKTKFGISVGSGTDALMISLMAIGVKKGDEVITAANTAIPTIAAIINSGATPVLADINLKDYLIKEYEKEFSSLVNFLNVRSIPLVVLWIPTPKSKKINNFYEQFFKNISEKNNLDFITMKNFIDKPSWSIFMEPYNGHLTRYANHLISEELNKQYRDDHL